MVAGKHMHSGAFGGAGASNNTGFEGYEIRSGMSVQVRRCCRVGFVTVESGELTWILRGSLSLGRTSSS